VDAAEVSKAILTSSITILIGVMVYVAGELLQKTFIEPYYKLSLTIAKIALDLVKYADIYSGPESASGEDEREVHKSFRELAAQLSSEAHVLVGYPFFAGFAGWPSEKDIQEAAGHLFKMSNSVSKVEDHPANKDRRNEIVRLLHIRSLPDLEMSTNPPSYFSTLQEHQYMNLVTFRKTGVGVKTPVWFVLDGNRLVMYTLGSSGKVKRIRNNPRVQVGPSDARGTPLGTSVEARARFLQGDEATRAEKMLGKKYGWLFKVFDLQRKLGGAKNARVFIEITEPEQ
jgi:uncharacterized protein